MQAATKLIITNDWLVQSHWISELILLQDARILTCPLQKVLRLEWGRLRRLKETRYLLMWQFSSLRWVWLAYLLLQHSKLWAANTLIKIRNWLKQIAAKYLQTLIKLLTKIPMIVTRQVSNIPSISKRYKFQPLPTRSTTQRRLV